MIQSDRGEKEKNKGEQCFAQAEEGEMVARNKNYSTQRSENARS